MCVCVSVIINQISSRPLLILYVIEVLLEVLKRGAPRDVGVFVHARLSVGIGVCMCVRLNLHSPVDSYLCMYVYVC